MIRIFLHYIKSLHPNLAVNLKQAGIKESDEKYIKNSLLYASVISGLITAFLLLVFLKEGWPLFLLFPVFLLLFIFAFSAIMKMPNGRIKARRAQIESDLLYSARFFLLKLESGSSLLNALIEVSKLGTKSSKFFEEVVSDIYLGTPIEKAIDNAIQYSVSPALTKIFEEIQSSLKTGADIDKTLKATLDDITKNHVVQIQAYGKTLSPISMFYMILGTIVPSIGSALLVVASAFLPGFISTIDLKVFAFLLFIVIMIQGFFLLLFKSIKPAVMQ